MMLSISIVNWNSGKELEKCLESIYGGNFKDFEVFVVDNSSSDGSLEIAKNKFPETNLILNTENRGFGRANNQAIKMCSGEYILILNPDIVFYKNTLEKMVEFMEKNSSAGALGIKLLEADGTEKKKGYFRKLPSITQTIFFYTLLEYITLKNSFLRNKFWETENTNRKMEISQIPGACLLIRKSVLKKTGLFDEDFELFFEDVDLCYRIQKNGFKLFFAPDIQAIHIGAHSIKILPFEELAKRFFTSMYIYFKKHHSPIAAQFVKYVIVFNFLLKIVLFQILYYLSDYKRVKRQKHIHTLWKTVKSLCKIKWPR